MTRRRASKFIPYYRGQSFRYFAVYRHPEHDTANTLAVSQDGKTIIKLARRTKDGKRDLATVESRPSNGVCLLKVPMWMALDREMDFDYPADQLVPQPWHSKDFDTYTRDEQRARDQYYEFGKVADDALIRNGGGRRNYAESGGAYHGAGV